MPPTFIEVTEPEPAPDLVTVRVLRLATHPRLDPCQVVFVAQDAVADASPRLTPLL